jgi:hypothetical protein
LKKEFREIISAGRQWRGGLERGRRRTRQDQISRWALEPGEIAELKQIRTERRKPVSSAGSFLKERTLRHTIQPFDLMSRRHPLSSTGASISGFASGS